MFFAPLDDPLCRFGQPRCTGLGSASDMVPAEIGASAPTAARHDNRVQVRIQFLHGEQRKLVPQEYGGGTESVHSIGVVLGKSNDLIDMRLAQTAQRRFQDCEFVHAFVREHRWQ